MALQDGQTTPLKTFSPSELRSRAANKLDLEPEMRSAKLMLEGIDAINSGLGEVEGGHGECTAVQVIRPVVQGYLARLEEVNTLGDWSILKITRGKPARRDLRDGMVVIALWDEDEKEELVVGAESEQVVGHNGKGKLLDDGNADLLGR
jgi:hypothetical protein